jgi:hypothetical protein
VSCAKHVGQGGAAGEGKTFVVVWSKHGDVAVNNPVEFCWDIINVSGRPVLIQESTLSVVFHWRVDTTQDATDAEGGWRNARQLDSLTRFILLMPETITSDKNITYRDDASLCFMFPWEGVATPGVFSGTLDVRFSYRDWEHSAIMHFSTKEHIEFVIVPGST